MTVTGGKPVTVTGVHTRPENVSQACGAPPSIPRTNQLCRWSAEPCVQVSGLTCPCVFCWIRSSPMAAAALGQPLPLLEDVLGELTWPEPEPEIRWLETVGGPRSPVTVDADAVDLARHLLPDRIVLVADAGLGTINAVQLSVAPFLEIGFEPLVLLNRFDLHDDLHRRNAAWLQQKGVPVLLGVEALSEVLSLSL